MDKDITTQELDYSYADLKTFLLKEIIFLNFVHMGCIYFHATKCHRKVFEDFWFGAYDDNNVGNSSRNY